MKIVPITLFVLSCLFTPVLSAFAVDPGAWTIAVLPDIQYYSSDWPGMGSAQTVWVRDHLREYNIRFVLQLGDLTNHNNDEQWRNARESMGVLDGHVPYFFVPGNHDHGLNGSTDTRDTLMNDYFTYEDFSTRPFFGGAKEAGKMENTYHLISAGGYDWIILCLEFGPTDSTIAWADSVMTAHPDRKAILITHAYLYNDSTRYDITGPDQSWNPVNYPLPDTNDGQVMWDELVKKHNFVLTVNGHVLGDGTGFRTDPNLAGQNVHQMLVNYQTPILERGGNSYLRLLTVSTNGAVEAISYSPVLNEFNTGAEQQFTFDFEWYSPPDTNANGTADYYDAALDTDGDGLNNYDEFMVHGTLPDETDSDGDGIADGLEVQIGTSPSTSEKKTKDAILNNAHAFGYYQEQGIVDLKLGPLSLIPDGTNVLLNIQFEMTEDVLTIPFAPVGGPIQWAGSVESNSSFFRVRAGE